ncbi:uncharacterized protein CDAR_368051 [Caerostris darwini]|uniref:Uncharacterized protein n=1 Tax=Caerostris darwini TaxID=1538125 RepID=A0AAV4UI29_9ARAC|nr:uncharacterized protein CDAR_368051 [Caerostris darwini]
MVIYISTFKSEVGHKLRPKSSFQGPLFRYHYGYSFILAVCGLMMCEVAGVCTVFLFIHWHKADIRRRRPPDDQPCRRHPRRRPSRQPPHEQGGQARAGSCPLRVDAGPRLLQLPALLAGHHLQHGVHLGGHRQGVLQGVLVRDPAQDDPRVRGVLEWGATHTLRCYLQIC